jgi:hypothetical protein
VTQIETLLGLTGGLGLSFAVSKDFQIVTIVGVDILTGSIADEWPYQGQPWFSVGVGLKFLDL